MTNQNEEKINKVLELLDSKKVGKNIEELLNRYVYKSEEVVTTRDIGVSDDLFKELKIKEINYQLNFNYKNKTLQILLTNNSSGVFPDGVSYDYYVLILIHNGITVLTDNVDSEYNSYGSFYRKERFYEFTLKSFKNGSWIDDLDYLVNNFKEYEINIEKIENEKKIKTLSDNIDLDPIDWRIIWLTPKVFEN